MDDADHRLPESQRLGAESAADSPASASMFAQEAARFREVLSAGRSAVFLQLFDFLVERSGDGRAPKEVEIALAVFDKDGADGTAGDSAVRVYVHRLRKRLDDHYVGKDGPRLYIPKGEYRIVLSSPVAVPTETAAPPWFNALRWNMGSRVAAAVLALALANLVVLAVLSPGSENADPARQLRSTSFWHPLALNRPSLLVSGDSFLLAEAQDQKSVKRLILDPQIQSRADFGSYLSTHPQAFYTLYDLDLRYAPIGTASATWQLLPVVTALHREHGNGPTLLPASQLRPSALETNDIVYVGRLSSLGLLASPLFGTSRFQWDRANERLQDTATGKRFGGPGAIGPQAGPRRDYGYIASFATPSGRHVLIVSGIGDKGVESMAQLVTNPTQIGELAGQRAATRFFEALYEVTTMDNIIIERKLVTVRPLRQAPSGAATPIAQ